MTTLVFSVIFLFICVANCLARVNQNGTEPHVSPDVGTPLQDFNINIGLESHLSEITNNILGKYGFHNNSLVDKLARYVAATKRTVQRYKREMLMISYDKNEPVGSDLLDLGESVLPRFTVRYEDDGICESLLPLKDLLQMAEIYYDIFSRNKLLMLECLMRNKARSFERDVTLVHLAAASGSAPSLNTVLRHMAESVDAPDLDGKTPLLYALVGNHSDVGEILLNHGADPTLTSKHHGLHLAVLNRDEKMAELMLPSYRKQNIIDTKDANNETALCIAARLRLVNIVRILLSHGANPYICCGLNTALHFAVYNRDITTIEIILFNHSETQNVRNFYRRTPLQLAVELGELEIVKFLLKKGADPYIPSYGDLTKEEVNNLRRSVWIHVLRGADWAVADFRRMNSLFSAVLENSIPMVELIIQADQSGKNIQNEDGHSVLHASVMEGYAEMSKCLLGKGVSPRLKDNRSWTALHYAVDNSDFSHSQMLLSEWNSKSECVHYKTKEGLTPLSVLTRKKSNDTKLLKLVLSHGAGCDSLDSLMLMHYAVQIENVEIAKFLLDSNVGINKTNDAGVTPLILAAQTESVLMTKYLLGQEADPNIRGAGGKTALHVAAFVQTIPVAEALLDNNRTQINAQDIDGITPMWEAALIDSLHMFQFLLNRGADPNIFSIDGLTVFHAIAAEGHLELGKSLLNRINTDLKTVNGTSALIIAITNNRVPFFNFLLSEEVDSNMADADGKTPLHHAAESSNPEFLEAIINKTKISLNRPDISGDTPLMLCLRRRQISPAHLLKRGANPFTRNADGYSAIHMAAKTGNVEAINTLTHFHGVNINLFDASNHTAMMVAAMHGEFLMVEYLLDKGADPCLTSMANTTILNYLVCYNDLHTIKQVHMSIKNRCNGTIELNRQDIHGRNLLACPAAKAIDQVFFYLVENGADLLAITSQNKTLLHFAAEGGSVYILNHLLRNAPALLEKATIDGETPLFFAARHGNDNAFELLLEYGAQRTVVSKFGETLIHSASFGGNVHIARIVLEDREINIEVTDVEGNTPLIYAVSNGRIAMTEFLIGKSANTLVTNVNGENVLRRAASTGNIDLLKALSGNTQDSTDFLIGILLSSSNDNLNLDKLETLLSRSTVAKNSLFFTAAKGDIEKLKEILKNENKLLEMRFPQLLYEFTRDYESFLESVLEEDQNYPSYKAVLTPLDLAILFFGKINTVKLLIDNFSVGNNKSSWTPLELACVSTRLYDKNTSIEKELVFRHLLMNAEPFLNHSGKFGWNIVHKAAWVGNSRAIYALYQKGADINKVDNYGRTPLHIAALKGFHEVVRNLLYLCSECVDRYDVYGFTALHLSLIYRKKKFYTLLPRSTVTTDPELRYRLAESLKFDGSGSGGDSSRDYLLTANTLLKSEASVDLQDKTLGWTALHWAAASGDLESTELLVSRGASLNIPSRGKETPMYLARFWGQRDVYLYLKARNGVW